MGSLTRLLKACPSTFSAVSEILVSSSEQGCVARMPGLTRLIGQFAKNGHCRKAAYIYAALPLLRLAADTAITNAAIAACGRGGDWRGAVEIFEDMDRQGIERDVITYSSVILALSNSQDWRRALELFVQMCAGGLAPDALAWHSLITAMAKAGKWQLAERLFIVLLEGHTGFQGFLRLAKSNCAPESELCRDDSDALTTLRPYLRAAQGRAPLEPPTPSLRGLGSASLSTYRCDTFSGDRCSSWNTNGHKHARSVSGSTEQGQTDAQSHASFARALCNSLLSAYALARPAQCERSLQLLHAMLKTGGGSSPDHMSMNAALRACAAAGQAHKALEVYERLVQQQRLQPSVATIATVMACAADAGLTDSVRQLWSELHRRDLTPNTACTNAYLKALLQQGRSSEALQQYRAMTGSSGPYAQGADADSVNLIMADALARGQPMTAIACFRDSCRTVQLNAASTNLLLRAHGELGHWREAHTAMLTAARSQRLDSEGVRLVQAQLLDVLVTSSAAGNTALVKSVLDLHCQSMDVCSGAAFDLTPPCLEAIAEVCAVPLQTAEAHKRQAGTFAQLLGTVLRLGVPLTRRCLKHLLQATGNPGQQTLQNRLMRDSWQSLRQSPAYSSHIAALAALCVSHGDHDSLRRLLSSGKVVHDDPALSPAQCREAAVMARLAADTAGSTAMAQTLCLATQGLWDAGKRLLALKFLRSILLAVSPEGLCGHEHGAEGSGRGFIIDALQRAQRVLEQQVGCGNLDSYTAARPLEQQNAAGIDACDAGLANALTSSLRWQDVDTETLRDTAMQLVDEVTGASLEAAGLDAVFGLLQKHSRHSSIEVG